MCSNRAACTRGALCSRLPRHDAAWHVEIQSHTAHACPASLPRRPVPKDAEDVWRAAGDDRRRLLLQNRRRCRRERGGAGGVPGREAQPGQPVPGGFACWRLSSYPSTGRGVNVVGAGRATFTWWVRLLVQYPDRTEYIWLNLVALLGYLGDGRSRGNLYQLVGGCGRPQCNPLDDAGVRGGWVSS